MSKEREEFQSERRPKSSTAAVIQNLPNTLDTPILLRGVREYLLAPGAPNVRLSPGWLAKKLNIDERELLGALAYGVRDGLLEMHTCTQSAATRTLIA